MGVDERDVRIVFSVEHTGYGWAVSISGRRVGMYPSERQALAYVDKRRAELSAKGERSEVMVRGRVLDP